ncbi:MAG TPA: O-antigen ligase family protein [Candidatus Binatia bacterium]|nr:O-antigen ligase family protein [Candidatus Binatia bacterium]
MWLLLAMIFIMPLEQNPYLKISDTFLGLISDFTLIKAIGLLGVGWALLRAAGGGTPPIFASRQARLFALFFACIVMSGLVNASGLLSLQRYLAFLLLLPFVLIAVDSVANLRRVIYALALSMILIIPYAVRQMIRFDSRLGEGVTDPNYFAANLLLVIPLAAVIAAQQPTFWRRAFWGTGAAMLVGCLALTASRGAFLGMTVAGMFFGYRRYGPFGAAGVLALLVLLILPTRLGERLLSTLGYGPVPSGLAASNQAHEALFWGGLRMVADAPLFGVGPYRFKELSRVYADLQDLPYGLVAHNTYLELAAETGLPTLLVLVLLIASIFVSLTHVARLARGAAAAETRAMAGWAEAMKVGLVGFLVAATFVSAQYEKLLWMVVFLSAAMERLAAREVEAAEPAPATLAPQPALQGG